MLSQALFLHLFVFYVSPRNETISSVRAFRVNIPRPLSNRCYIIGRDDAFKINSSITVWLNWKKNNRAFVLRDVCSICWHLVQSKQRHDRTKLENMFFSNSHWIMQKVWWSTLESCFPFICCCILTFARDLIRDVSIMNFWWLRKKFPPKWTFALLIESLLNHNFTVVLGQFCYLWRIFLQITELHRV